jgi:hypothetical protein
MTPTEPTICPTCNRPLPKLAPEVRAYLRENARRRAAAKRARKAAQ